MSVVDPERLPPPPKKRYNNIKNNTMEDQTDSVFF